jgi:hypothetical protein
MAIDFADVLRATLKCLSRQPGPRKHVRANGLDLSAHVFLYPDAGASVVQIDLRV